MVFYKPFTLGLRYHVLYGLVSDVPVGLRDTVHQQDVDVVHLQLFAESLQVGLHFFRLSAEAQVNRRFMRPPRSAAR